jgi:hypothetical protein
MGLFIRTIGIARARTKIGLANLVYNLWTPPAQGALSGLGALDAYIYPACCWNFGAPGLDGDPLLLTSTAGSTKASIHPI